MSESTSVSVSSDTGIGAIILFGILAALKVIPYHNPITNLSWWWVTSPLWISFVLGLVLLLGMGVIWIIFEIIAAVFNS